jgi:hypothetical protein
MADFDFCLSSLLWFVLVIVRTEDSAIRADRSYIGSSADMDVNLQMFANSSDVLASAHLLSSFGGKSPFLHFFFVWYQYMASIYLLSRVGSQSGSKSYMHKLRHSLRLLLISTVPTKNVIIFLTEKYTLVVTFIFW